MGRNLMVKNKDYVLRPCRQSLRAASLIMTMADADEWNGGGQDKGGVM